MLFDLHNDFPTELSPDSFKAYIKDANNCKVTAAIWTTELDCADQTVYRLTHTIASDNDLKLCPIAIEDIGFTAKDGLYKVFDFSKYLYCSLTWNYNNAFAGGALDDGTLTRTGKEVISRICSCGCYVDLAHLNRKSFFNALDSAEYVICSHTGFNEHLRSLNNEQISALAARKTVIGLCTVSAFTGAKNAIEFADIVDNFVQIYGDKILALGTDYNGSKDIPNDISGYDKLLQIAYMLENKGYGKAAIENIFYNNANRLITNPKR